MKPHSTERSKDGGTHCVQRYSLTQHVSLRT